MIPRVELRLAIILVARSAERPIECGNVLENGTVYPWFPSICSLQYKIAAPSAASRRPDPLLGFMQATTVPVAAKIHSSVVQLAARNWRTAKVGPLNASLFVH